MTTTSASQASSDGRRSTAPSVRLPIRFSSETPEYHGFLTYSAHRVMYNDVIYPTAMHLHEALKYLPVDPAFAERIRACPDPGEVHTLSAELQRQSPNSVRPDWPTVFLQSMEDVILLKFQQHSNLRGLLLNTLDAPLVYAEPEAYWGETGSNHLGHMLERVRTSLQRELEERSPRDLRRPLSRPSCLLPTRKQTFSPVPELEDGLLLPPPQERPGKFAERVEILLLICSALICSALYWVFVRKDSTCIFT